MLGVAALLSACSDQGLSELPDPCDNPAVVVAAVPTAGCRLANEIEPVTDPWDVALDWSWPAPDDPLAGINAVFPAVVGPLADDDADGSVDLDDATLVVVSYWRDEPETFGMSAIDGRTGVTRWTQTEGPKQISPAIADLDSDGWPDLVGVSTAGELLVLRGSDGSEEWRSAPIDGLGSDRTTPAVADLDGDGSPEILAGGVVFSGTDGSVEWSAERASVPGWVMMTAADLDLDGQQEVLTDGSAYTSDGTLLWRAAESEDGARVVVLQADDDDEAEVGWLGAHSFSIYEADGERIRTWDLGERESDSAPCAADFDGDGSTELAWTSNGSLSAFELDGTRRWTVPVSDDVLTTPCTAFDLDGDGAAEILYADQVQFLILRGKDGEILFRDDSHRSTTGYEYPVVADLDHDGHAEILLTGSADGDGVLRALGHSFEGWPPAGPSWGTWAYAVTNSNPTGRVPRSPEPSWLAFNMWLARPAEEGTPLANLDVDASVCRDGTRIVLTAANRGAADAKEVRYRVVDGSQLVAEGSLGRIDAGSAVAGVVLDDLPVHTELSVVIDPDELVEECDEANNTVVIRLP